MRTIRLREYETQAERLSSDELEWILSLKPLVSVSPRADGLYDLRAESTVGTVVLPELQLLIRPKVGLPNVFFLLAYGAGLTEWREEAFPYEEDQFFEAIAWLFEAEIRRAASTGLVRDYRTRQEALPTVRGRIDLDAQIRRRQGQVFPLDCRYQEYSEDTELNRVVKDATRHLFRMPNLDLELGQQLRHHYRLFAGTSDASYPPSAVPEIHYNRLNEAWRGTGRLAQLILRADSVRDRLGSVSGSSFTVDMNKLFERFVEVVVREEAQAFGWDLEAQAARALTKSVTMRPDLVLRRAGVDRAVGDAKYKELSPAGWPHADLYQLLAYCVGLGLPRGLLIYAEARRPRSEIVKAAGITLEIRGVDLAAPAAKVLAQTREAARHLVIQAQEARSPSLRAA